MGIGAHLGLIWTALALDWALGDPACCHPVRLMGAVIGALERFLRPRFRHPWALRAAGTLVVAAVVLPAYLLPSYVLHWLEAGHFLLGWGAGALLLASTVAARSLALAARHVRHLLVQGDLDGARQAVGRLVARDTDRLSPEEVVRAAVETVAENTVDGVTAPLFYAFVGGVPLAFAYRAVNTLDSMLGYRNERYRDFGWCAAKLDDLANFLPARFTAALLCLAAGLTGLGAREAWRTVRRDARRHPSPNSGFPEAAVAGALGLRLGGVNYYSGVAERRPYLGQQRQRPAPEHISLSIRLMLLATLLAVAVGSLGIYLVSFVWLRLLPFG